MDLTIDLSKEKRRTMPPQGTPDGRMIFQRKLGEGAEGCVYLAVPPSQPVETLSGESPTRSSSLGDQSAGQRLQERADTSAAAAAGVAAREDVLTPMAVKVVTGESVARCRTMRRLWSSLIHPYLVFPRRMEFQRGRTSGARCCFVEMELCDVDLLDMVVARETGLDERTASVYGGHLASALEHLHGNGIAHQDVKLENVFLKGDVAKLGDLGSVVQILQTNNTTTTSSRTTALVPASSSEGHTAHDSLTASMPTPHTARTYPFMGTAIYAPPEIAGVRWKPGKSPPDLPPPASPSVLEADAGVQSPPGQPFPFSGDIWALGVTLYCAIAGHHPWDWACVEGSKDFRRFVRRGAAAYFPERFSPDLKSLLTKLLAIDPRERPTAAQVLADPWITHPPAHSPSADAAATATAALLLESTTLPAWPAASGKAPPVPVTPTNYETPGARIGVHQAEQQPFSGAAAAAAKPPAPPAPPVTPPAAAASIDASRIIPASKNTVATPLTPEMEAVGGGRMGAAGMGAAGMGATAGVGAAGGGGGGADGAALPKIARVSPSPLTLPGAAKMMMSATAAGGATAAAGAAGASGATAGAASPPRKRGLLEFLATPSSPVTLPMMPPATAGAAAAAGAACGGDEVATPPRKRTLLEFLATPPPPLPAQRSREKTKNKRPRSCDHGAEDGVQGVGKGAGAEEEGEVAVEDRRMFKRVKKNASPSHRGLSGDPATSSSTRISFTTGERGL